MAGRFYNRRFASRSSRDGCAGVISVNTLFWKILVTRVKRVVRGFVSCACCGAPKLEFTSAFQGAADMAQRPAPTTFVEIDPSGHRTATRSDADTLRLSATHHARA